MHCNLGAINNTPAVLSVRISKVQVSFLISILISRIPNILNSISNILPNLQLASWQRNIEGIDQENRHLGSGNTILGSVCSVWIAAGDALIKELLDEDLSPVA